MLLVAFPSLHADVVCGILHLCTQSSRRLFLGAQVFPNDDKHTARCAMAVGTQRCYWFGKTRLKLELGFYVATTFKQYVGDQQLKFWCIQNVGSLQKHENLAFCWFLILILCGGTRVWRQSTAPPADAYCIVFSRYGTRIYTLRVFIRRLFQPWDRRRRGRAGQRGWRQGLKGKGKGRGKGRRKGQGRTRSTSWM